MDKEQMWRVQEEFKVRLKEVNEVYQKKLEGRQNNAKEVRDGMMQITGFKAKQQ